MPRVKRKTHLHLQTITSCFVAIFLATLPLTAWADTIALGTTVGDQAPPPAPVLITEIQPGSAASASEEFIELYNRTAQSIDFSVHAWRLEIASSTATGWESPLRTITLKGVIASGQSYTFASQYTSSGQVVPYLPGIAAAWFSAGISAAAGHIRLVYTTNQLQADGTCGTTETVVDEVEWSAPKSGGPATPSLDGRAVFVAAKSTGIAAGSSLVRLIDPAIQTYIDTNSDVVDFGVSSMPTPGTGNTTLAATSPQPTADQISPAVLSDGCDPSLVTAPPDPTDSTNDGTTQSPLQQPVDSPPVVSAGDDGTRLADGNGDSPPYVPAAVPAIPAADQGLFGPQISELLPNPAAPQTDAHDEFIELYNPNDVPFDLSNFVLESGLESVHTYTLPVGTILPPRSFRAFLSVDTKLGLSNAGGQVVLLDPLGGSIAKTDPYSTAKDGQAWIFANDTWQWTILPTPNAANAVHTPVAAGSAKKPVVPVVTSAKKVAAVKAASTKAKPKPTKTATPKPAKTPATTKLQTAAAVVPDSPVHPSILAAAGVLALLYGAYEYRTDMANRVYQLREHRNARREARARSKGG